MTRTEEIELVYMTPYIGMTKAKKNMSIRYRRLTGVVGTHTISPNKMAYKNCYGDFEDGKSYVVISVCINPEAPEGRRHWVWTDAYELLDEKMAKDLNSRIKAIDPEGRIPGYITDKRTLNTAVFQIQQAHKIKQSIKTTQALVNELLEF